MRYGIILAAGKQTRFADDKPKCLWPYKGEKTILQKNIEELDKFVDVIFVVVNKNINNREIVQVVKNIHWGETDTTYIEIIEIESGLGTGHALYETLKIFNKNYVTHNVEVMMIWGDSIQDEPEIINSTIKNFNGKCTVPLKFEDDCYMNFMIVNNYIIKVWQPPAKSGYHDFSFFMFDLDYMYVLLDLYHHKYLATQRGGRGYKTRSEEMNFIDMFNEFGLSEFANAVIIDDLNISSINAFNTVEEYNEIIKRRK